MYTMARAYSGCVLFQSSRVHIVERLYIGHYWGIRVHFGLSEVGTGGCRVVSSHQLGLPL